MKFCRLRPERPIAGMAVLAATNKGVWECCKLPRRGSGLSPGNLTIFLYFKDYMQLLQLRYYLLRVNSCKSPESLSNRVAPTPCGGTEIT